MTHPDERTQNAAGIDPPRPLSLGRIPPADPAFDPQTVERRRSLPMDKRTDWMITATGRRFCLLDPNPDDVCIQDIAIALAKTCRFNGHTTRFYSIAEHSFHVSALVPEEYRLAALLHDAAEAYVGDVIRPLKRLLPTYERIEEGVHRAIAQHFGIPETMDPIIHRADAVMLLVERAQIIHGNAWEWIEDKLGLVDEVQAAQMKIGEVGWTHEQALAHFTMAYDQLTVARR